MTKSSLTVQSRNIHVIYVHRSALWEIKVWVSKNKKRTAVKYKSFDVRRAAYTFGVFCSPCRTDMQRPMHV